MEVSAIRSRCSRQIEDKKKRDGTLVIVACWLPDAATVSVTAEILVIFSALDVISPMDFRVHCCTKLILRLSGNIRLIGLR